MPFSPILIEGRTATLHKAIVSPNFKSRTVLVSDTWESVDLWLRRKGSTKAAFHWQQARSFYEASIALPKTSAPLTAYYCFLNATKALLIQKGRAFTDKHGVSGHTVAGKVALNKEMVQFKGGGILASFCDYFDEPTNNEEYNLKPLFYNMAFIHRSYTLTFTTDTELFIPLSNSGFVRRDGSTESWFCAEVREQRFQHSSAARTFPPNFERDRGNLDKYIIRRRNRFQWRDTDTVDVNLTRLTAYHKIQRKHLQYIHSPQRLWYLKKHTASANLIGRNNMTMIFAAMHKLSELARYDPVSLARHFDSQHNWLLTEFISNSLHQFVDEISAEMTGQEFMVPGVVLR